MSINKMLIDATHPEETRVVVLKENRVEEFDYESAARKLLRGSIYLAKITRVEPSLQASFVDYGGNRHGFLAFAEIHPDYYQIPHADKLALLEQESREQAEYDNELDEEEVETVDAADTEHEAESTPEAESTIEAVDDADRIDADGDTVEDGDYDFEANAIDVSDLIPQDTATEAARQGDAAEAVETDAAREAQSGDGPEKAAQEAAPVAAAVAADDVIRSEDVSGQMDGTVEQVQPGDDDAPAEETHFHITADKGEQAGRKELSALDDESEETDEDDVVESLNDEVDDDAIEAIDDDDDDNEEDEAPVARARSPRPRRRARHYKIQEVIKRRQIVLIQVVKEERGNKGAALTTYLSLAGRYTVLMPNTARGGGISRKITNVQDRKRLKAIAQELEVPEGMGLIIRTAGAARTKQEIKRDFEYLLRLWENVRSLTLESTAPSLVYEEGNLIKRSIRDLYTKEIDEVVVAGDQAFKEAKGFMRMLMPSHAKNVIKHDEPQSLFAKYRIENQLNAMFSPNVQLKSGGYLVINQTEALVAIDVNSGKSTREFSIEETALNTNLEAAEELARQLKLRDLAGLIVVDFIDMEEKRNNRAVERRLKDALRADRARIQVGRISHFGLLEMSRQRLRTGVLEGSTTSCEHCQGSGIVRSIESVSLAVLRGLEDALVAGKMKSCVASCAAEVALYLLNQKREFIQELEARYNVVIHVRANDKQQGANFIIEPMLDAVVPRSRPVARDAVNIDAGFTSDRVAANDDESDEADTEPKGRRRRRRRGGRRDENQEAEAATSTSTGGEVVELAARAGSPGDAGTDERDAATAEEGEARPRRSRRRGRRGGRRHRDQRNDDVAAPGAEQPAIEALAAAPGEVADQAVADASGQVQISGEAVERHDQPGPIELAPSVADEPVSDLATATEDTAASDAGSVHLAAADTGNDVTKPDHGDQPVRVDTADADSEPAPAAAQADEEAAPAATTGAQDGSSDEVLQAEPAAAIPADAEQVASIEEPETSVGEIEDADQGRAARSRPVASEPVIQRVMVGPNGNGIGSADAPEEADSAEAAPKPQRRGWWQRQFGG